VSRAWKRDSAELRRPRPRRRSGAREEDTQSARLILRLSGHLRVPRKRTSWEDGRALNAPPRSLLVLSLLLLLLAVPPDRAHATSLGEWTSTTSYPIRVAGDSCVTSSGSVYCVGGFDASGNDYDNVYYAQLTPTGMGAWSSATPYPAKVDSAACFTEAATIYCVGGESSTTVFDNVYSSTISQSGIGGWSSAAAYPHAVAGESCVVYSGYVYCVGGFNTSDEGSAATYYASISSGITTWTSTTPYPLSIYTVPCVAQANYIYCIAGQQENTVGGTGANTNYPTAQVYYAPLSSSGIGAWSASPGYPQALASPSCVAYSGDVYCLGGYGVSQLSESDAYSSAVSPAGLTPWTASTPYPVPFDLSSCVSAYSDVYCIGGRSYSTSGLSMLSSDYYAVLAASGPNTTSSSSTTASSASTTSTVPEFPTAVAIPLVLAACMTAVAVLGRRGSHV
jgi:hypothetical protein